MERLHVHYLRELVHRLRAGASQRSIAHDLGLARMTVHKYAQLAAAAGYLDASRPLLGCHSVALASITAEMRNLKVVVAVKLRLC